MTFATASSSDISPWLHDPSYGGMSASSAKKSWEASERRRQEEQPVRQKQDQPGTTPLKLTYFNDCRSSARKRWILKGVVARGETSSWIGPPGAGKSALLTEISIHCAAQMDWRNCKARQACGVVIFALERADLYRRRLLGYQLRDKLDGLPVAVADAVIDLLNPNCVEIIAATVKQAEQQFGCNVGLIVIDTYAKGIAAGGGDEDRARDQNRAAANLRGLHAQLDLHIALVGHTGKDENRGARGSNAHEGDVDVMVQISGNGTKIAEVTKANDQPQRALATFRMEQSTLGKDEDGEPEVVYLVSAEPMAAATSRLKSKREELSPIHKAALDALFEVISDGDTEQRPDDVHVPVGVTCVTLAKWKERLLKLGIINKDGSHREQFKRIHVTLKNRAVIGVWDDVAWPVT